MTPTNDWKDRLGAISRRYGIYLIFVGLIIVCSIISPIFFTYKNLMNVARQISITGILAFGETLLIISGMIDLSFGSVMALAGMVSIRVFLSTGSFPAAFLTAVVIACGCTIINGFFTTRVKLPAFIATMSMDLIARGAVYIYTGGIPIYNIGDMGRVSSDYLGGIIPIPVVFLLVIFAFCWVILSKTKLGRSLYAVGGNADAANASGISVAKTRVIAYIIAGVFVGIAGTLQMARLNSGLPDTAIGYHGDAIASAVIGGTSFTGGIGTATGTLIGAFIMGIISNILNLMGVQSYVQQVVKGLIILAAVSVDLLSKSKRVRTVKTDEQQPQA